ncbi:MAG: hypothetical protein DCF20_08740 [Pseudanabaena sp.]|nr:MAG: hypothetical protein DCF20_08740 [Pseudanabaena sp.]
MQPNSHMELSSINISALHKVVSNIGGEDPEFLIELIDSYLDSSQSLLQELYTSLIPQNFMVMERAVHTLRSSSSLIGADDLAALCRELEINLRNQKYEAVDIKINRIADEYTNVKAELENAKYH